MASIKAAINSSSLVAEGVLTINPASIKKDAYNDPTSVSGYIDIKDILYSTLKKNPTRIPFGRIFVKSSANIFSSSGTEGDPFFWWDWKIELMENAHVILFAQGDVDHLKFTNIVNCSTKDGKLIPPEVRLAAQLIKKNSFNVETLLKEVKDFGSSPESVGKKRPPNRPASVAPSRGAARSGCHATC